MDLYSTSITAESIAEGIDLSGKTILITGVSSGIGYETMRVLFQQGARVIGTARSTEKAQQACARLSESASSAMGEVVPAVCELSDPNSIHALIGTLDEPLDVIIANAGVMALPEKTLIHGVESHTFINHMGHFMLVNGLLSTHL
jgi:WW domain-containing oxidoreductase